MDDQIQKDATVIAAALTEGEASAPELIRMTGLGESAVRLALVWLLGAGRVRCVHEVGRAKSKRGKPTRAAVQVWSLEPAPKRQGFDVAAVTETLEIRAKRCRAMAEAADNTHDIERLRGKASAYEHAAELVRDEDWRSS